MLTRLEVDGFKNLLGFEVNFGPFNCIAGPNGVGKSNILDAIHFLSLLADNSLTDAAHRVRGELQSADVRDLFWTDREERAQKFRLAAEMIVEPQVVDEIGREVENTSTYLRYEIEIKYEEPDLTRGYLGGLFLFSESLYAYTKEEAKQRLHFPHAPSFFDRVIRHKKGSSTFFVSTKERANREREIIVHANGNDSASLQIIPIAKARRTIIATASMWSSPTILAARREMQNWRLLSMEPTAMRRADPLVATPYLTTEGGHLHATLHRVANTPTIDQLDVQQVYGFIRTTLAQFFSIKGLEVEIDPVRQLLMTQVQSSLSGAKVPARALSDGTLRFLALAVLREDPEFNGLLCIEEPENGIHPSKMEILVNLLKEMTVDTTCEPDEYNPMRQVIIATHSPTLVQLLSEEDLLIAIESTTKGPSGKPTTVCACWPLSGTWRSAESQDWLSLVSILAFLTPPSQAQIKWQWESQKKAA